MSFNKPQNERQNPLLPPQSHPSPMGGFQNEPKLIQRRRRSENCNHPQSASKALRILALLSVLLCAGTITLCAYAFLERTQSQTKLDGLRNERMLAKQKHEERIDYYVGMRRRAEVLPTIQKYADMYQVHPSYISAIIARESGYQADARSHVGARGLMQVMENTGKWIQGKLKLQNYTYDRLDDPDINIRFGTWYLNYLSSLFQGNPVMMTAAYHAGPNNVNTWAMRLSPESMVLSIDQIPKDNTRDYVRKVMEAYALYYEYDLKH